MTEKFEKAKEQLLSIPTVVALITGLLAAGGGSMALRPDTKAHDQAHAEADKLLVYRVEQLETRIAASKEAELDKRITRIEDTQKRTDEVVQKLADLVNRIDRIVMRLPATGR